MFDFKKNVLIAKKFKKIFLQIKKNNGKIVGYGASAKAVTVLNFCQIKEEFIDHFLDTTENKIGKYLPGTESKLKNTQKINE